MHPLQTCEESRVAIEMDEQLAVTRQHATSILALLHAHTYLLTHLTDFFVRESWHDVPLEWRPFLLSLSADRLAKLPSLTRPVPGAPDSLVSFVALAAALALPRTPSQEATRLCWTVVDPRTVSLSLTAASSPPATVASTADELWSGMDAKKAHEVARMTPCVATRARAAGCRRVLDVGCGQGYVDRLLAAQQPVRSGAWPRGRQRIHMCIGPPNVLCQGAGAPAPCSAA